MAEHSHEHGHDDHGHHGGASTVDETQVSNSSIVGWGLVAMVVFFGSAAALTSIFYRWSDEVMHEKVLSVGAVELPQIRAEEAKALSTYGYNDKAKGLAHIPIEEGYKQVVLEAQRDAQAAAQQQQQPAAPAPVPVPAPAPGTQPAAPAPAAQPAAHPAPAPAAPPNIQKDAHGAAPSPAQTQQHQQGGAPR